MTTTGVILTDAAAGKIAELLAAEGQDLALRVAAAPGGCSGMQYRLFFDDQSREDDFEAEFSGVRVVVDAASLPYLAGATVDFSDTPWQQGFTIDNPNAPQADGCGCSCGDSGCC